METRYPNTCIAIQDWRKRAMELVYRNMLRRHSNNFNRRESRQRTSNWVNDSVTKGKKISVYILCCNEVVLTNASFILIKIYQ